MSETVASIIGEFFVSLDENPDQWSFEPGVLNGVGFGPTVRDNLGLYLEVLERNAIQKAFSTTPYRFKLWGHKNIDGQFEFPKEIEKEILAAVVKLLRHKIVSHFNATELNDRDFLFRLFSIIDNPGDGINEPQFNYNQKTIESGPVSINRKTGAIYFKSFCVPYLMSGYEQRCLVTKMMERYSS